MLDDIPSKARKTSLTDGESEQALAAEVLKLEETVRQKYSAHGASKVRAYVF